MPTNDEEIIKKYNLLFGAASEIDLENALDEARAEERAKVQKEMLNGKLQVKSGTTLGDFLPQSEIRKLVEIVKKEMIEPSLNEARTDGYKQGQKDATNRIFEGLQSHAYILIKPPKGATRKENVALDLTKAEFEDFKKQFEVN